MEFYDVVLNRSSVRSYRQEPVAPDALERILEAARWAPSWCNKQCWHFVVVQKPEQVQRLRRATQLFAAPAYVVACGNPEQSGKRDGKEYYLVDVAIAMEHLVLAARAEGLGTCWMGFINEEKVRTALGIPEGIRVVAITPLGYPAEDFKGRLLDTAFKVAVKKGRRKPLEEIVHRERW